MNPEFFLKRLASHVPLSWQQELKRFQLRRQIQRGRFETTEPEFLVLDQLVSPGDWVIDVGANVGHYTKKLSDLIGTQGRVIAVEPVPETFALLAANVSLLKHRNVTLLNLAASDRTSIVGMMIPSFDTGLKNYYEATVTTQAPELNVMTIALDLLVTERRITLIKIDAEGHDHLVLQGLRRILARDHPTLIVETDSPAARQLLENLGYVSERLAGSPNALFRWWPDGSTSNPVPNQ